MSSKFNWLGIFVLANILCSPCHSLILDVNDLCWSDLFKPNELAEIRRFRAVEMPGLSVEVETYLDQLRGLDAASQYIKIDSSVHPIASDSNWLQKSYRDTFRLLASGFFPFESQTEVNVVNQN